MHIGVDLMGGEETPEQLYSSVHSALSALPSHITCTVFVDSDTTYLPTDRCHVIPVHDVMKEEENPLNILRQKREISLCMGLDHLAHNKLDALVSLGNTGLLTAVSKRQLSLFKGLVRPSLLVVLPTFLHPVVLLDVGANTRCTVIDYVNQALLGIAYWSSNIQPKQKPRVGLLNIGTESYKGTPNLRDAHQHLEQLSDIGSMLFVGNVEASQVFEGVVDVLVTDGFSGNIFLKTAEGMAAFIMKHLPQEQERAVRSLLCYTQYPGALVCGVKGLVLKCHGYSNADAIERAIRGAVDLAQKSCLQTMEASFLKYRKLHNL